MNEQWNEHINIVISNHYLCSFYLFYRTEKVSISQWGLECILVAMINCRLWNRLIKMIRQVANSLPSTILPSSIQWWHGAPKVGCKIWRSDFENGSCMAEYWAVHLFLLQTNVSNVPNTNSKESLIEKDKSNRMKPDDMTSSKLKKGKD